MKQLTPLQAPHSAHSAPFKLLTIAEAMEALGIGKRTLQERMKAQEIGFVRIGRSVRFHPDDLAAFIESNRVKPIGWKGGKR